MRPLAAESLILTGGHRLTAFGTHVSKLTTNWIHVRKRTKFTDVGLHNDV